MRQLPELEWFELQLQRLQRCIPAPILKDTGDGQAYRFAEESAEQAILLKVARCVSLLAAATRLLELGFVIEAATLRRALDETSDEIAILSLDTSSGNFSARSKDILKDFWREEQSFAEFHNKRMKRSQLSRRKAASEIVQRIVDGTPDKASIDAIDYAHAVQSGYVHGAAPHIMELYNPSKQRFETRGLPPSPVLEDHLEEQKNYVFRLVCIIKIAADALKAPSVSHEASQIHGELKQFFVDR